MCKTSIFKTIFSLFIQLYIAKVPIGSGYGSGSGEKFSGSGSYQKGPDPQPCVRIVHMVQAKLEREKNVFKKCTDIDDDWAARSRQDLLGREVRQGEPGQELQHTGHQQPH